MVERMHVMGKTGSSIWILIDVLFAIAISILIVWPIIDYHLLRVLAPIFFLLLGSAFLFCKTYRDVSLVERVLFWVSENVYIPPKLESRHLLIGLFLIIAGIAYAFFLSHRGIDESLGHRPGGNLFFWGSLILILIGNLLIGLYNHYRKIR